MKVVKAKLDSKFAIFVESRNNVETAVARIKETAVWRRTNNVYNLLADDISILKSELPYQCTGYTDEGNPGELARFVDFVRECG